MARNPRPLPPYFSGTTLPKKPSSPILSNKSLRKLCSLSSFAAVGAISFSAKSRARSRTAINSSDSSKSILPPKVDRNHDRRFERLEQLERLEPNFRRVRIVENLQAVIYCK